MKTVALAHKESGFTLIELLVVAVVLAIFGALVIPLFMESDDQARVSHARASVRTIQLKIDEYRQVEGIWPSAFDPAWFRNYVLPKSPWTITNGQMVNYVDVDNRMHPVNKTLEGLAFYYWYNRKTGVVRIRVPDQGSAAANVALYNQANNTQIVRLDQLLLQ